MTTPTSSARRTDRPARPIRRPGADAAASARAVCISGAREAPGGRARRLPPPGGAARRAPGAGALMGGCTLAEPRGLTPGAELPRKAQDRRRRSARPRSGSGPRWYGRRCRRAQRLPPARANKRSAPGPAPDRPQGRALTLPSRRSAGGAATPPRRGRGPLGRVRPLGPVKDKVAGRPASPRPGRTSEAHPGQRPTAPKGGSFLGGTARAHPQARPHHKPKTVTRSAPTRGRVLALPSCRAAEAGRRGADRSDRPGPMKGGAAGRRACPPPPGHGNARGLAGAGVCRPDAVPIRDSAGSARRHRAQGPPRG